MKKARKKSREKPLANSRSFMFVASSVWVALILVILVLRPGGTTPVDPRPAPRNPSLALRALIQEANELTSLGEYEAASLKYRAALQQEPEDVSLRFALGTALSHVGRQEETVEHFRWVVTRGNPALPEVRVAHRWLVTAGELAEPVAFVASKSAEQEAAEALLVSLPSGKLMGTTERTGPFSNGGPRRLSVDLAGADDWNRELTLNTSVKLGDRYEFGKVPPGNYRLTARVAETPLWKRNVTVESGKETVLDLTRANSVAP